MPRRSKVEELKALSGSTTVDRHGDLEIFRSAQDTLVVSASSLMSLKYLGADYPYLAGYKYVTRKRVRCVRVKWGDVCVRARARHFERSKASLG